MKLRTQLILGYTVVFALMIMIAGITYRSTHLLLQTQQHVTHTHNIILKATQTLQHFIDMETGERGFTITGNENFLEPYTSARKAYEKTMAQLKALAVDSPVQLEQLQSIDALFRTWLETAALPLIRTRRESRDRRPYAGKDDEMTLKASERGKALMDTIRQKTEAFINLENSHLSRQKKKADEYAGHNLLAVVFGTIIGIAIGIATMLFTIRTVTKEVGGEPMAIARVAEEIARGNLNVSLDSGKGERTGILKSIESMLISLRENREKSRRQDWLKSGIARINEVLRGDPDNITLASKVITEITTYLKAHIGIIYMIDDDAKDETSLMLLGSYAYKQQDIGTHRIKMGEGLAGQSAMGKKQIVIHDVPDDYLKISSALGGHTPRTICVTPFLYEDHVKGIVEIGTLHELTDSQLEYLEQVMPAIAIAFESALQRTELAQALEASMNLSQELQMQQEELRTANKELEDKTNVLERQKEIIESANQDLEQARVEIEKRAEELEMASKYKSEFLANMSHELRTPLNSLLILSNTLADNKQGNLSADQLQSVNLIHDSGSNLLSLINEILDMSKIEAGRMELHLENVATETLGNRIFNHFNCMANEKDLTLEIRFAHAFPPQITTDTKRLEQILRNLVGNAIKFTKKGKVLIEFNCPDPGLHFTKSELEASRAIAIAVTDTGIGIAPEKQKLVFEAFQQADGSTARLYGGTGLGLSISRQLADLLGGEIHMISNIGEGSTFILYLPLKHSAPEMEVTAAMLQEGQRPAPSIKTAAPSLHNREDPDSAEKMDVGIVPSDTHNTFRDKTVMVADNDMRNVFTLSNILEENGIHVIRVENGQKALEALEQTSDIDLVLIDIMMPVMNGYDAITEIRLQEPFQHLPIIALSSGSSTEAHQQCIEAGADDVMSKPVELKQLFSTLEKWLNH